MCEICPAAFMEEAFVESALLIVEPESSVVEAAEK